MDVKTSNKRGNVKIRSSILMSPKKVIVLKLPGKKDLQQTFLIRYDGNSAKNFGAVKAEEPESHEELVKSSNHIDVVCRTCTKSDERLVPIFGEEGIQLDLVSKMHKYLPIRVAEDDILPNHLCHHCAVTISAFHEMVEGCLDAEQNLQKMYEDRVYKISQDPEPIVHVEQAGIKEIIGDIRGIKNEEEPYIKETADYMEEITTEEGQDTKEGIENMEEIMKEEMQGIVETVDDLTEIKKEDQQDLGEIPEDMENIEKAEEQLLEMPHYRDQENLEEIILKEETTERYEEFEQIQDTQEFSPPDEFPPTANNSDYIMMEELIVETPETPDPSADSEFICISCEKPFGSEEQLRAHSLSRSCVAFKELIEEFKQVQRARRKIDNKEVFNCTQCNKLLLSKRGFIRHLRVHADTRPCICKTCGKAFRISQDLVRHIKEVHQQIKNYPCAYCPMRFVNNGARMDHERVHTGERPYNCEHCPKTFKSLKAIYIHNRIHTDYKPHKCEICGDFFRTKQRLSEHVMKHTGIKAFACDLCTKTFSSRNEVNMHRGSHNTEKRFGCGGCDLKFTQTRYLRNHIRLQHREMATELLILANEIARRNGQF